MFDSATSMDCSMPVFPVLSLSLLKLIESVMLFNHLSFCCPLLLLPSIFPSTKVFFSESALHIRWPKYWSFSLSISPSNEYSWLISFRMDWFDLLAIQGDELRACYTEWSKSETERQISYIKVYTWSLERRYWWNYLQSSSGDTDVERRHVDTERRRRGWGEWRKQHGNIYTTTCKIHSQWEFSVWLRELNPVLCDNLEG